MNYICRMIILIFLAAGLGAAQISAQNDADIILTWSSSSLAPVWYPGKPLPSSGSQIIVSASPEILIKKQNLGPQDLTYNWFLNYRYQKTASGKGRQDFSFIANENRGTIINVKVEIYNPAGYLLGEKSLKITLAEATVQIHHLFDNQFLGTAFRNNASLPAGRKISFVAMPYFFNIADAAQIEFRWRANNEPIILDQTGRPNIVHLEINENIPTGSIYDLLVVAQNNLRKNESALNSLRITIR